MPTAAELRALRQQVTERKVHYRQLGHTVARSEDMAKSELSADERQMLESSTSNKR